MEIKIFSWNCNGKLKRSVEFIKNYSQFHIIHLSETKHNDFTNFNIPKKFTPLSRPGIRLGDTDRGGNIIFIKSDLYKRIRKTRYFEWGIILYFNESVLVFVYFVPSDSRYYRDESFTELSTFLCNITKTGKAVFIAGDHNSRFGKLEFTNRFYEENIDTDKNSQGKLLARIYNESGFYPLNHLSSEHPNPVAFVGDFTFFRGEKKSQVDFLFTNNHTDVSSFCLANEGLELSDHKIIIFTLKMKLDLPSNALLKWSKDSNKVGQTVTKTLFRVNFDVDHDKMQHVLTDNILEFGNSLSNVNFNTENVVENFNNTLQKSFTDCKTAKRKKKSLDDDWNTLEGSGLWERIDWSGKLSSTKDTTKPEREDLFRHFKGLYAPTDEPSVELPTMENEIYIPVTDDPISKQEVLEAFNDQGKGYNYTNAILRPFINVLLPYMVTLMNIVFFASSLIKWAPSMLLTIPKKGSLKLVRNWRGIQVGEYINSWYDRILCNRIRLWMNIDEFQSAYQKGKSCNTQIFTFRTITELSKKMRKPIYISYVDLEKAFDKVRRCTMLQVLSNLGIGTVMLKALKNLYSMTKVYLNGIGEFITTSGIRQGASSSVYLFIIFINGLFKHLRSKFTESAIYGCIHSLVHADDTLLLAETYDTLKEKVVSTYEFFGSIAQSVNVGKSKYMCLDSHNKSQCRDSMVINGHVVKYTTKEMYLGHYITDDNSLNKSIACDLEERASNVIVKFRNFINNNKSATIQVRLKVFQSCFCSTILSNCEIWGQCFPKKLRSLYNRGLKLALEVRLSTPTALIFLETKQQSVLAIVRKRQLKFWQSLQKEKGSELYNLIKRAENTQYIKHYIKLESIYENPDTAFEKLNQEFYNNLIDTVNNCKDEQTKLRTYKSIYGDLRNIMLRESFTLNKVNNNEQQRLVTRYIVSSHSLASECGKWSGDDKICKQCNQDVIETLDHFIFECDAYSSIRRKFIQFPVDLKSFYVWEHCGYVLELLHMQREK